MKRITKLTRQFTPAASCRPPPLTVFITGVFPVAPSVNFILLGLSMSLSLSVVCLSLLISSRGLLWANKQMGRGVARVAWSLLSDRIIIDQGSTSDVVCCYFVNQFA